MSKIVDFLTCRKGISDKKKYDGVLSSSILTKNLDTDIKEKIASTYIFNPLDKPVNLEKYARNETNAMPAGKAPYFSAKIFHFFPWLISLFAIFLLLINIAYQGKINIKIEVVKNAGKTRALISDPRIIAARDSGFLVLDGQLNDGVVKKVGFYGAALKESRISNDGLHLINDGTFSWASVGFDFAEPMDLIGSSLEFFARGLQGGESLEVILRDSDSNSYFPQAHNLVFNGNMGGDWQFVSVPFSAFKGYYNARHVNHIGFEFGTQTTANKSGASVYIKNIKVVKK